MGGRQGDEWAGRGIGRGISRGRDREGWDMQGRDRQGEG